MDIYQRFLEVKDLHSGYDKASIGVLSEKTLHKIIKNLYEEDISKQEVKIGPYFADICDNGEIIEVQTKQFNRLRQKLDYFLSLNKYKIHIIYPVFNSKMIYKIDELGEITGPKKSPKKFKIPEVFYELYKIKSYLDNENIKITLLIFDIDEYRVKGKSRSGYICDDRIPKKLVGEINLNYVSDYKSLIPKGLPLNFTVSDLAKLTKVKERYANNMLNVLKYLKVVEVVGKDNRKYLYKVID